MNEVARSKEQGASCERNLQTDLMDCSTRDRQCYGIDVLNVCRMYVCQNGLSHVVKSYMFGTDCQID